MSDNRQDDLAPPAPDQVIEAYLLRRDEVMAGAGDDAGEASRVGRKVLTEFMRRYPHAADALADFAATASIIENSPDMESQTESESLAEEESIVRRGMESAARLLAARRTAIISEETAPLTGLRKAGEARGLTIQALALQHV